MFSFPRRNLENVSAAVIAEGRFNILYDDYPVLFTGFNSSNKRLVGSYVSRDEDADDTIIYYVMFQTSENLFKVFEDKAITYRELLQANSKLFLLEKNYDEETENYFIIDSEEFPESFLPSLDSFYPAQLIQPSMNYTCRLTGKLADQNKADAEQAGNVAIYISALLRQSINLLNFPKVKVLQKPSSEGSFKLNFEVQFQEDGETGPHAEEALAAFQVKFLDYCINKLFDEVRLVFSDTPAIEEATDYISLRSSFKELRSVFAKRKKQQIPDEKANDMLKKDISKSISSLSRSVADLGSSFTAIELLNNADSQNSNIVSVIDSSLKYKIDSTAEYIESISQNFEEDAEGVNYRLAIYNLNTDTRVGNAIIFLGDDKPILSKPRIKILGIAPLEKTIYTNSLYEGEMINVIGKARRIGNKVLSIEIESE